MELRSGIGYVFYYQIIISWLWNSAGKISYWSLIGSFGCCTAPSKFSRTTRPLPPSSYYVMSYFLSLTPVDCIAQSARFFFALGISRSFNLWFESRGTMERIINSFQPLAYLLYPVHHNPANSNACLRTTIPSFPTLPPLPGWNFFLLSVTKFFC